MTAQVGERLFYDGKWCSMCATPLGMYFSLSNTYPDFADASTACWRGYLGSWELIDNRLYLTGIKAQLIDGTSVSLETLFPGYPERVFAHWYSGEIRIPQGKLLEYVHAGYASRYEKDLFLTITKGELTGTYLKFNGENEHQMDSEGYQVGGYLTFGKRDN